MRQITVLILILTLSACSGGGSGFGSGGSGGSGSAGSAGSIGSLNPFTWFGGGRRSRERGANQSLIPRDADTPDADNRRLVDQVTSFTTERTPGGVIARATGLPESQGYYDAELVSVQSQNAGELVYEFKIRAPYPAPRVGTPFSREVVAAVFVTAHELANIRVIRINATRNSRTARP